jgi:PAS domain S-box-containing protein
MASKPPGTVKEKKKNSSDWKSFFELLLDNCSDAFLVLDEHGFILYQNQEAGAISGYELKEIEGRPFFEFIHPDYAEDAKTFFRELAADIAGRKIKELRVKRRDGSYRWVECSVINVLHNPSAKGFIIKYRDTTGKDQAEPNAGLLLQELIAITAEANDYKFALDASSVVTIVDADGRIKYVNDTFCKLSQFSREEVIGHNPRIFNSGYHSKEFFKELWDTVLAGKIWKGEMRNRKKHGGYYWGNTTIVPFLNEGKPYQFLVIRNDITEKKVAEEKLEVANHELKRLFNTIQEVLFSVDIKQNRFIQISPACEKVYGYKPEDFYDNRDLWQQVIHPDDRGVVERHFTGYKTGQAVKDEYRIIHKDGGLRWITNTVVPTLDENNQLIRLDGVVADDTERKAAAQKIIESERKIRSLIENMQEGIANCEMLYENEEPFDFMYLYVNDKFEILTGLKDVVGKKATEAIPGIRQQDDELFKAYSEVVRTGCSKKIEYYVNAMSMWFSLSIYHTMGNFFAVIFEVIDERKRAEAEIKELNELLEKKVIDRTAELEQANKELEAFSYTVSHDLQAPLRAVKGFAGIMHQEYYSKLDDTGRQYLSFINDGAGRMSQLITELLAFARFGKVPLVKQVVKMDEIVAAIIEESKTAFAGFKPEIVTGTLPEVFCDPGLVKQVWVNLIYNAIKYSSKKENPVVEIGSEVINGDLTYYVKDNGAGFDMQHAGKLFNVFKRLHTDQEFEGTGVGLALAHRIVTRHGGQIWTEAKVNEGATFYFTLPTL